MKIGTLEHAKLIYRRRRRGFGPLPRGWKKVGEGTYRTCYLSPDGVVYKLDKKSACDPNSNRGEFENYKAFRKTKLPKGWRIAPTYMHSFDDDGEVCVVAMKYVEGRHEKVDKMSLQQVDLHWEANQAWDAFDALGLMDLHEENYLVTPRGTKVIIDLGE